VLALVALARPDGALWVAVGLGFVVAVGRPRGRSRWRARRPCVAARAVRRVKLAYYGELLPNTYYAKSAAMRGGRRGSSTSGSSCDAIRFSRRRCPWRCSPWARPAIPAGSPE